MSYTGSVNGYEFLTDKDMDRIVRENAKNDWGFTDKSFYRLAMKYKNGDGRDKEWVIARLIDANFHTEAHRLMDGDILGAIYTFRGWI